MESWTAKEIQRERRGWAEVNAKGKRRKAGEKDIKTIIHRQKKTYTSNRDFHATRCMKQHAWKLFVNYLDPFPLKCIGLIWFKNFCPYNC